jgi:hypothetical protein
MPRFTTLAALAVFMLGAALMAGCDSGSKGSSPNAPKTAPPTENQKALEPAKVPDPGK